MSAIILNQIIASNATRDLVKYISNEHRIFIKSKLPGIILLPTCCMSVGQHLVVVVVFVMHIEFIMEQEDISDNEKVNKSLYIN